MIKFGAITIDVSHPLAFSEKLLLGDRGRYTAVFNDGFRGDDEVRAFAEKRGLKICSSIEELAKEADVLMVHSCNWDKHLDYARRVAACGKPVFIDKPIVGSLKDAQELKKLQNEGATILGTSSLRYCKEVKDVCERLDAAGEKVVHINATVGLDEYNYAIHGIELILAIVRDEPVSVKYLGTARIEKRQCDSFMISFAGGATAIYQVYLGRFTEFNVTVLTTGGDPDNDRCFKVDNSAFYAAMLDEICNKLEGKPSRLASLDDMISSVKVALAAKCSKESGGKEIRCDAEELEEVCYDGYAFESEYSASARKIYL